MEKPRIIIVDRDINYISALLNELAGEIENRADIELITDNDFFSDLFSRGQKADVLIVSEEMYSDQLKKHDIKNIYVMNEESESSRSESGVRYIFKYSSAKKICREVVDTGLSSISQEMKKSTGLIVVTAPDGGVGKTTIALGISCELEKNGFKTLYINGEDIQSFQFYFSDRSSIRGTDTYVKLASGQNKYDSIKAEIRNEGFDYLPAFKSAPVSLGIDSGVYGEIAESAKAGNIYDYIVMDAGNTFDANKLELIGKADKVVIVTGNSEKNIFALKAMLSDLNISNREKYIFICNLCDGDEKTLYNTATDGIGLKPDVYIGRTDKKIENIRDIEELKEIKKAVFTLL